jgi:hypothetical protein
MVLHKQKHVAANPIVSRYSSGDRLYRKGEIKTVVASDQNPNLNVELQGEQSVGERERREMETLRRRYEENVKKRQTRSDKNLDTFFIYYKKDQNNPGKNLRYFLYEKNTTFLNYVLKLPDKKISIFK